MEKKRRREKRGRKTKKLKRRSGRMI